MRAVYRRLLDNAIAAALSAIEVYNKPDFKYRNEIFVVLVVNAWELLLKAKIIKDHANRINSIYVYDNKRRIKRNRAGGPMTIEITRAIDEVALSVGTTSNLKTLIMIRDSTVHFYNNRSLDYIVYALGVPALTSFQRLTQEWFGLSLAQYNFYIMPIGFTYGFQTFQLLSLEKQPSVIANLIKSIVACQQQLQALGGDELYNFVCEVKTELRSAKKFPTGEDLVTSIDNTASDPDAVIITRTQAPTDRYPLSYRELLAKVKKAKPLAKQRAVDGIIRDHGIKANEAYATFVFHNKAQEDAYKSSGKLPTSVTSIYNEDAVRFIIAQLP